MGQAIDQIPSEPPAIGRATIEHPTVYRSVARGSATGLLQSAVTVIVGIALPPFVLRHVASEGYGYWILLLSIAGYLNLGELGLGTGLAKVWAERRQGEGPGDVMAVWRAVAALFAAIGIAGVVVSVAVTMVAPAPYHLLPLFVVSAALALLAGPFAAIVRGAQRTDLLNIVNTVALALGAGATIALLAIGVGFMALAVGGLLAQSARLAVLAGLAHALEGGFRLTGRAAFRPVIGLLGLGATEQVMSVWVSVVSPTNRVLLHAIVGASALATYDLGSRVVTATVTAPVIVLPALLPAFSYLTSLDDRDDADRLLERSIRFTLLIALPLCWFLMLLADPLVAAWLGREAEGVALAIRILAVGTFVNVVTGPYTQLLIGRGRPRLSVEKVVLGCVASVVLPVGLALARGLNGFLVGEALATAVPALVFLSRVSQREGVAIARPVLGLLLRSSLGPLMCSLGALMLYRATAEMAVWGGLAAWGGLFVAVFAGSVGVYWLAGLVTAGEAKFLGRTLLGR